MKWHIQFIHHPALGGECLQAYSKRQFHYLTIHRRLQGRFTFGICTRKRCKIELSLMHIKGCFHQKNMHKFLNWRESRLKNKHCLLVSWCALLLQNVGIDVEEKTRRTNTNILAFAKRWFSSPEIAWLDAFTDPEEQRQKFIQLWTLKEAYVKALGKGISGAPLKDFSIHIKHLPVVNKQIEESEDAGSDSVVSKIDLEVSKKSGAMRTNWQFLLFQPTNLHYASVCIGQDENHLHEDEMSQMSSCCYLKVHAWKTVPLVKDESQSVKETIIASTNARSF
ncbi:uncharacterized protein LOC131068563 isoform X6 [Cryptomeria japonica]|uniref:uncharacterized protein LOC131068563 isoform X6 n=1 Tax=Cryptomeria japonica TaxID=3369 RepID=UPI0027DA197B|nr:uncharacterized protein LOC131068563 isoform X6 [Cryptomeria japonica]